MIKRSAVLMFSLLFLGAFHAAEASPVRLNDAAALRGLKEAKAVFLIDVDKPNRVAHVLKTIELTDKSMRAQRVTPRIVVVLIGPSVAFLTKNRRGIAYRDERAVSELQGEVGKLAKLHIHTEACGVAMKGMDLKPKDMIEDVQPVGNGFVEAIGYQAQGYQLVPVY
jgi:intracellular sulfur oxidation DsrE/DsrF family protein